MRKFTIGFMDMGLVQDPSIPREYMQLGGAETALRYMAEELAELGHEVHVVTMCVNKGKHHGVHWHDITKDWQYLGAMLRFDVMIVNRAYTHLGARFNSG